jgi:hypothetical protein
VDRIGWAFTFAAAAFNLVRLPKLLAGGNRMTPRDLPHWHGPIVNPAIFDD